MSEVEPVSAPETVSPAVVADSAPPPAAPEPQQRANWDDEGGAVDADLSALYNKLNPARDEAGRFQSRASDEPAKPETEVQPDQPPAETEKQAETPAIPPPQSWSAEVREKWSQLPPDLQAYVAKREGEAHEAITRQGQELKAYEPVKAVIEQHRDIFERNGVTADDGISRLLAAERMLEQNAPAAIAQLARAYGVDLTQFAGTGEQQPADGATHALNQRIAYLESQLNETSNRIAQRERAEMQTQQQSMTQLIEGFAKDKPDWADLEKDVLTELTGINAAIKEGLLEPLTADQKLSRAYERAQRNNPAVFAKRLEAERKADEEKRMAEAKKRAEDAKRANGVNVKSTPASGRTISTIDDDLRATYRKHNAA